MVHKTFGHLGLESTSKKVFLIKSQDYIKLENLPEFAQQKQVCQRQKELVVEKEPTHGRLV